MVLPSKLWRDLLSSQAGRAEASKETFRFLFLSEDFFFCCWFIFIFFSAVFEIGNRQFVGLAASKSVCLSCG